MIFNRQTRAPALLVALLMLSGVSGASVALAQSAPASARTVSVLAASAKKVALPIRVNTIGTVQPVSTVTLRSRVESQILEIGFSDGAIVKPGDVLVRLDSRGIDAQIRQAEATVERTNAQIDQARRDVQRNEALAANEFASKVNLENARTQVATLSAQLAADQAALDNLRVQQSYYTIKAPIGGRVGVAGIKVGNIAKTGDGSPAFAQINQISPIYVAFNLPQRYLPQVRAAVGDSAAFVEVSLQGVGAMAKGRIAVVDNTVDTASGTVMIRALFDNPSEVLWPGALCTVSVTLGFVPDTIVVPKEAVQMSQKGAFVFVVENGAAKVRTVKVGRTVDGVTEIVEGLAGTETVVVEGQVQLVDGVAVDVKPSQAGAQ